MAGKSNSSTPEHSRALGDVLRWLTQDRWRRRRSFVHLPQRRTIEVCVSDSSATKRSGVSEPRTNHDFNRKIGVDDIADFPDCPKKFEYVKDFLAHSLLQD